MNKSNRILWIDIAKGLSIILVVMGHSGHDLSGHYLSWFRMPLFFMLSGMLFKPILPENYAGWTKRKITQMMIPYISYGIALTLMVIALNPNLNSVIINFSKLIYGGMILGGPLGVFWFITCLLLTQLLFGYLSRYKTKTQLIFILTSYSLAHIISMSSLANVPFPGNADVTLFAVSFYGFGYYMKGAFNKHISNIYIFIILILFSFTYIYIDYIDIFNFSFDMKTKNYTLPIVDLVIPITLALTMCFICYRLSKVKVFQGITYFGYNSITIMYLHIPINIIVKRLVGIEYGLITFTIVGVLGSLFALWIFDKSNLLSRLFLNKNKPKIKVA